MRRSLVLVACLFMVQVLSFAQSERPLLLRHPTISRTQVVFSFAGDLWIVARDGGDARRLTSGIGVETDPFFRRTASKSRSAASTTAIRTSTSSLLRAACRSG